MRRASLIDEQTRQMRARELSVGASRSRAEVVERSTTKGVDTAVGNTEGVSTEGVSTEGAGSGKPDPPAC